MKIHCPVMETWARGLAEVYRLAGFEPAKAQSQLKAIDHLLTRTERYRELPLTEEGQISPFWA